ncbi:MAG: NTP transferase domain-containing protein [Polyangiales bacterium]
MLASDPSRSVCAIILAAGRGERMGRPKALVPWGERSLAVAHAEAALSAGCAEVVVVTREPLVEFMGVLPDRASLCLSRELDEHGAAGSLVAAMRLHHASPWFAVCPVDVDPDAWRALPALVAAITDARLALRPVCDGRRGHPVLVRSQLVQRYRDGAFTPLRDLLRASAERVVDVTVAVEAVLTDLDTPEQLAARTPSK